MMSVDLVALGERLDFDNNDMAMDTETFLSDVDEYFTERLRETKPRRLGAIEKMLKTPKFNEFRDQISYMKLFASQIVTEDAEENIRNILNYLLNNRVIAYLMCMSDEMNGDGRHRDWAQGPFYIIERVLLGNQDYTLAAFLTEMVETHCKEKYNYNQRRPLGDPSNEEYRVVSTYYTSYIETLDQFFDKCYSDIAIGLHHRARDLINFVTLRKDVGRRYDLNMQQAISVDGPGNIIEEMLYSKPPKPTGGNKKNKTRKTHQE